MRALLLRSDCDICAPCTYFEYQTSQHEQYEEISKQDINVSQH